MWKGRAGGKALFSHSNSEGADVANCIFVPAYKLSLFICLELL